MGLEENLIKTRVWYCNSLKMSLNEGKILRYGGIL